MRHCAAAPLLQQQAGLRAIQSLKLPLLVSAQHDGVLGRIQIQADNIFLKPGIVAEPEGSRLIRLQSVSAPEAAHTGFADARRMRHSACRALGGFRRLVLQRHVGCALYPALGDARGAARPRRVLLQSRDAADEKAVPPGRCLLRRHARSPGTLLVLPARLRPSARPLAAPPPVWVENVLASSALGLVSVPGSGQLRRRYAYYIWPFIAWPHAADNRYHLRRTTLALPRHTSIACCEAAAQQVGGHGHSYGSF